MQMPRVDVLDPFLKAELASSVNDLLADADATVSITLRQAYAAPSIDFETGVVTRSQKTSTLTALRRVVDAAEAARSAGALMVGDVVYLIDGPGPRTLIAEYAFSNGTGGGVFGNGSGETGEAMTFAALADVPIDELVVEMNRRGSPPGNLTANIYAITGESGSTGVPTGSALAASATIAPSTLLDSVSNAEIEKVTFKFPTPYVPSSDETLSWAIELSADGDATNHVRLLVDPTSPTYAGNRASLLTGTWIASTTTAHPFALYATGLQKSSEIVEDDTVYELVRWHADPLGMFYEITARRS